MEEEILRIINKMKKVGFEIEDGGPAIMHKCVYSNDIPIMQLNLPGSTYYFGPKILLNSRPTPIRLYDEKNYTKSWVLFTISNYKEPIPTIFWEGELLGKTIESILTKEFKDYVINKIKENIKRQETKLNQFLEKL